MRKPIVHVAVSALIGSIAVACSGRGGRAPNTRVGQSGAVEVHERLILRGCVQMRPAPGKFALNRVFVEPLAERPQQDETAQDSAVSNGSWVRLTRGTQDLNQFLGQRVTVIGTVVDRGENTLGKTGRPAAATELSSVPPVGTIANGNAPEIAVEKIERLARPCSSR